MQTKSKGECQCLMWRYSEHANTGHEPVQPFMWFLINSNAKKCSVAFSREQTLFCFWIDKKPHERSNLVRTPCSNEHKCGHFLSANVHSADIFGPHCRHFCLHVDKKCLHCRHFWRLACSLSKWKWRTSKHWLENVEVLISLIKNVF